MRWQSQLTLLLYNSSSRLPFSLFELALTRLSRERRFTIASPFLFVSVGALAGLEGYIKRAYVYINTCFNESVNCNHALGINHASPLNFKVFDKFDTYRSGSCGLDCQLTQCSGLVGTSVRRSDNQYIDEYLSLKFGRS